MNLASVTVFINPSCGPCLSLKKWMRDNQIPFNEKDLMNDVTAAEEFRELGGQFTPTTIIETEDEKFEIIGANTEKIKESFLLLNKGGL